MQVHHTQVQCGRHPFRVSSKFSRICFHIRRVNIQILWPNVEDSLVNVYIGLKLNDGFKQLGREDLQGTK